MTSGERSRVAVWDPIPAADVRLQAARILESPSMRRAGRLRQLLQFFVEEWIACGDRPISQRRIAEEALGKPAGFSPTSNADVRIYVRRLRQRLAAYSAGPGASDPLVLEVTPGPYRLSATPQHPHLKKKRGGGAKPVPLVLLTALSTPDLPGELQPLGMLVPIALVPYLLGRHGLVAIGPVPRDRLVDPPCESPMVRMSVADYLLDGGMTAGPQRADGTRSLEIVVRLHEVTTGRHVWSRSCADEIECRNLPAAAERLAARLAAVILTPTA